MYILDTDHLSLLLRDESELGKHLRSRLDAARIDEAPTTIITFEEQSRGWLAAVSKARNPPEHIESYRRLLRLLLSYRNITVYAFDEPAALQFERLRRNRIRIGTQDLRIASIALRNETLLTRNRQDFSKVPGLKIEDWCR